MRRRDVGNAWFAFRVAAAAVATAVLASCADGGRFDVVSVLIVVTLAVLIGVIATAAGQLHSRYTGRAPTMDTSAADL